MTAAAIALRQGKPDDAIKALEPPRRPSSERSPAWCPPYLRAEALLRRAHSTDARREYQKVLQHRGVDPFAPVRPAGAARAGARPARGGDIAAGRAVPTTSSSPSGKGRTPDFPPLVAARAEYARLDGHAIDPVTTPPADLALRSRLERIGRDGPTEIYRARDLRLERDVALKLLRPEATARPGRARALPARSAHRLARHPSAHLHRPRFRRGRTASRSSSASCSKGARSTRWSRQTVRWRRTASSTSASSSPTRSPPRTAAAGARATSNRRTSSSPTTDT